MRRERRGELLGELRAELAARVRGLRPRVVEAHRALRDGLLALEAVEQRPREADLEPVQVLVGRVEAVPRLGESLTRGAVGSEEGRPIRRARCPYGRRGGALLSGGLGDRRGPLQRGPTQAGRVGRRGKLRVGHGSRSEEHTSELQSQSNLVCRLLLEKKKKKPDRD